MDGTTYTKIVFFNGKKYKILAIDERNRTVSINCSLDEMYGKFIIKFKDYVKYFLNLKEVRQLKLSKIMKVGDIVTVTKSFTFNGRVYEVGDRFTIVSDSGQRGWDIKDKNGKIIYETMWINHHYQCLKEVRKKKLDEINGSRE